MRHQTNHPNYDFSAEVLCLISTHWTPLNLMALDLFTTSSDVLASIMYTTAVRRKLVLITHKYRGDYYVKCHPASFDYLKAAGMGYWQRVYGGAA